MEMKMKEEKKNISNNDLQEMTMDLIIKRLSEESPHLSNTTYGNGVLEIVYAYNAVPRINDRFSIIKQGLGEDMKVSFPDRRYDEQKLKQNIRLIYYIVSQYLSTRLIPQGRLTIEFINGAIADCYINNEGTYNDLLRTGKPKLDLDDILFEEEE